MEEEQSHTGPVTHLYCMSPHSASSMIAHCVVLCVCVGGNRHVKTLQTNTHRPALTTRSSSHLTHLPSSAVNRQLRETHHKHCIFEKQIILCTLFSVWHKKETFWKSELYFFFLLRSRFGSACGLLGGWLRAKMWNNVLHNSLSPIPKRQTFATWLEQRYTSHMRVLHFILIRHCNL